MSPVLLRAELSVAIAPSAPPQVVVLTVGMTGAGISTFMGYQLPGGRMGTGMLAVAGDEMSKYRRRYSGCRRP